MPETHDKPKAPRSEAQIAAARRNGAKSRGPVSDEGKAASSRNALRHGLTAFHLALSSEDHESFNLVLADYMDEYRPVGPTQTSLVEKIAFAQWQMYRAWTAETAALNVEIETNRAKLDEKFTHFAEPVRVADAIESSLARTGSLPHINRCLARINREYFQSLKLLREIQKEGIAETNPTAMEAVPEQQEPEIAAAETNPTDAGPGQPATDDRHQAHVVISAETNSTIPVLGQPAVDDIAGAPHNSDAQHPNGIAAETNPKADESCAHPATPHPCLYATPTMCGDNGPNGNENDWSSTRAKPAS